MPLKWNNGEERMLLLLLLKQAPKFTVDSDQLIYDWNTHPQASYLSGTPTTRGATDRIRLLKQIAGGMNITVRGGHSVAVAAHATPDTPRHAGNSANAAFAATPASTSTTSTATIGRTPAPTADINDESDNNEAHHKVPPPKFNHRAKITAATDLSVTIKTEPNDGPVGLGRPIDYAVHNPTKANTSAVKNDPPAAGKRKRCECSSRRTQAASDASSVTAQSTDPGATSDAEDPSVADEHPPATKRRVTLTRLSKTAAASYTPWTDGPGELDSDDDIYDGYLTRREVDDDSDGSWKEEQSDEDDMPESPGVKNESGDGEICPGLGKCKGRALVW